MRILIVGAGIAGLATYHALARRGFHATIVERNAIARNGGTGLFLPGNGVRALGQLGLLDAFMDQSHPVRQQSFFDERGRLLNAVDAEEYWREVAPCRSIKRLHLERLLKSGIDSKQTQYRRIVDIQSIPGGCHVTFEDGGLEEYDLIIGADGVNSAVRKLVFPEASAPVYVGNVCWRFIVPNASMVNDWTVMLASNRSILGIPVTDSETYVYADISVDKAGVSKYSPETDLLLLFGDIAGPLRPALELSASTSIHFAELVQLQMSQWHCNRIVFVGDAAHASSPSMAQGACSALEDALVLADELAICSRVELALQSYQTRRKKRMDWVHSQCAARDTMRRLPRSVRNVLLRFGGNRLYQRSYAPLKEPI